MTRQRRFALGALVWVLVVAAGATLVWTVISQAGSGVAGELPPTTVTSSDSARTPDQPSGTGPATPSTSTPDPSGQPAGPRQKTWQGAAGRVVAECRGGAISVVAAQPTSGWSVELDKTGPEELRVEFKNGEGKVRVEAGCVDGAPSFAVGTERDD
jgi:hypothetical protein